MATVGDVSVADSAVHGVTLKDAATASPALPINLFSQQQSDIEFGALVSPDFKLGGGAGGSLSRDTSQAWHGAASLKVVFDGSFNFQPVSVNIPVSKLVAGAVYTVSVFLRASPAQAPQLRMFWEGNDQIAGNHSIGPTSLVATPNSAGWTRYSVTATMPNPIVDSIIGLRLDTGSTAQAITFWMDGLQMEAGSVANVWTPGSIAAGVVAITDSAVHAVAIGDMRAP